MVQQKNTLPANRGLSGIVGLVVAVYAKRRYKARKIHKVLFKTSEEVDTTRYDVGLIYSVAEASVEFISINERPFPYKCQTNISPIKPFTYILQMQMGIPLASPREAFPLKSLFHAVLCFSCAPDPPPQTYTE